MRKLMMAGLVLSAFAAPVTGQNSKPKIIPINPEFVDGTAIIIPAGSKLQLVSLPPEGIADAKFSGRLTLTGTYELRGYGDEAWVNLRPDRKSLALLPYWRERWEGGPKEIYLDNGWTFARAVVGKAELQKLQNENYAARGRATIIVDEYQTSIECDRASYSARFVSVVDRSVQVAANRHIAEPGEGEC